MLLAIWSDVKIGLGYGICELALNFSKRPHVFLLERLNCSLSEVFPHLLLSALSRVCRRSSATSGLPPYIVLIQPPTPSWYILISGTSRNMFLAIFIILFLVISRVQVQIPGKAKQVIFGNFTPRQLGRKNYRNLHTHLKKDWSALVVRKVFSNASVGLALESVETTHRSGFVSKPYLN